MTDGQITVVGIIVVALLYIYLKGKLKEGNLKALIQKYGEKFGPLIAQKKITIGMSKEMVILALENPIKTDDKIIRENYVKEVLYYGAYKARNGREVYKLKITIENDKVTEIRTSES